MGADEEAPACLHGDVRPGGGKSVAGWGWVEVEEEGGTCGEPECLRRQTLGRSTGGQTGINAATKHSQRAHTDIKRGEKIPHKTSSEKS